MKPIRLLALLSLPLLVACSDQRAAFEIQGPAHSLSLIRTTGMPWDSRADYALVVSRMPDCMRRHAMPPARLDAKFEVFSPGNDAWILRQGNRMYVTETRTCEGFAKLEAAPEGGLGRLMGTFEMQGNNLVFVAAPRDDKAVPAN